MTTMTTLLPPDAAPSEGGEPRLSSLEREVQKLRSQASASSAASSTWMVIAVVVAGMALVASVVAWGYASNADTTSAKGGVAAATGTATTGQAVTVTLSEFKISPAMINASVGDKLTITNSGSMQHNFTIEGTSVSTQLINPGSSTTIDTSSLKSGTYTVSCNVSGHKAAGMSAMLMLANGSGSAASGTAVSATAASSSATAGLTAEMVADGMTMTPAAMEQAMKTSTTAFPAKTAGVGGQDLAPTVLADGTKQFELTAAVVDWEVSPGKTVKAWTYNGTVPGPTMRVNPGDKVKVILHNHLPEATTIHFHGITGPQVLDGTPYVSQDPVEPGADFTYAWTVSKTPEVGMYHSHFDAVNQVPDGMAGAFIVGDQPIPTEAATQGAVASQITNQVLFFNDSGTIGLSLNGKSFPATAPFVATQNQWLEVTYFNEGQMIHPMHLHEIPQMVISRDGFALSNPEMDDTVLVAPGQRITVLIHATDVGTWVWHCHILSHAEGPTGMFGMVTALVVKPAA